MPEHMDPESGRVEVPSSVAMVYGNGFSVGMSNADVALVLTLDNAPQVRIAISYTTAKSLRDALVSGFEKFERITGHDFMTSDQISAAMTSASDA